MCEDIPYQIKITNENKLINLGQLWKVGLSSGTDSSTTKYKAACSNAVVQAAVYAKKGIHNKMTDSSNNGFGLTRKKKKHILFRKFCLKSEIRWDIFKSFSSKTNSKFQKFNNARNKQIK